MKDIDVPDWVALLAEERYQQSYYKGMTRTESMKATVAAALEALVVPAGYRALGKPCAEGTQYVEYTHNSDSAAAFLRGGLTVERVYALRQEKPK